MTERLTHINLLEPQNNLLGQILLASPFYTGDSLVAQMVKSLPAMQETQVQSLSRGDPLEKEMATHSSIIAWNIPWTQEPGGYHP